MFRDILFIFQCVILQVFSHSHDSQHLPSIGEITNVTSQEGESVRISCPVINKTNASIVQWFRLRPYAHISNDDTILSPDMENKYGIVETMSNNVHTTTLIISNIQMSDVGRYRCRVQISQVAYTQWPLKDGLVSIGVVSPSVSESPLVPEQRMPSIGETSNITALEGDDIHMDCPVLDKTPDSTVQWFRVTRYRHISNDDTLISIKRDKYAVDESRSSSDGQLQPVDTTTLTIRNVQNLDAGRYSCRIRLDHVAYTQWPVKDVYVTVRVAPPSVSESPLVPEQPMPSIGETSNITAQKGDDITLDCPVLDKTPDSTVQWFRVTRYRHISNDDTLISIKRDKYAVVETSSSSDGQLQPVDTTTLTIRNVQTSDAGRYSCRIKVDHIAYTRWPVKDVYVSVGAAPQVLAAGKKRMVVDVGQNINLTIRVYGSPKPAITWYKGHTVMGYGEVLHLDNLQAGDGGEYRCVASNGILPDVYETYYISMMQDPMCSVHSPHVLQVANTNMDASMSCYITGYPIPKAMWKRYTKHGIHTVVGPRYFTKLTIPKDNSGVMTSTLKIYNVSSSDFGTYICTGSNELGDCEAEIRLVESRVCIGPGCHVPAPPGPGNDVIPDDDDDKKGDKQHQSGDKPENSANIVFIPVTLIIILSYTVHFLSKIN